MGQVNGVELFFWVSFLLGLGYSLVGFLGHGLGGSEHDVDSGHDVGHDTDTSAGDHHVSPLNSLTIAAFCTGVGGLGLLGMRVGGFGPWLALLVALIGGLVLAAGFFYAILRPLYRSQSTSSPNINELVRSVAVVQVSIPGTGVGEIMLTSGATRFSLPARAQEGQEIATGEHVAILRISKGVAYVVPLDEESLGFKIGGELE